jgi:hypothetical protein
MLSDASQQLLTAFVDGELSPRQREVALQLLHESSEARELLMQLQENANRIKRLPRQTLDAHFAVDVLEIIEERSIHPEPLPIRLAGTLRWLPYAVAGVAAAVVFVASLAGVIYVLGTIDHNQGPPLVKHQPPEPPEVAHNDAPPKGQGDREDLQPSAPKPLDPLIARVIEGSVSNFARHMPERGYTFAMRDLPSDKVAKEVATELKKSDALQLEVAVRNNPQAIERLRDVLKKHDIRLALDPASVAAAKQASGKTELLVYADNVSAEELAKILRELAHEEKKAVNPFDKVTVASLSQRNGQQVTELMGTDPTKRVDPIATANNQQPKNPPKNPKNPKASPPKAGPPKAPPRVMLLLPQAPQDKASAEVNQFMLQPVDPGSLRVLIRLRQE